MRKVKMDAGGGHNYVNRSEERIRQDRYYE